MPGLDGAEDKLVVTHVEALRAKYGSAGVARIRSAVRAMVSRDGDRGLTTRLVDLSRRSDLDPVGLPAVTDPSDHASARAAIDALCEVSQPDYLVLLGGPDVVPHVPLANPMPAPDPDTDVPSDLPYACPGSTGVDAATMVGPTRVVGRLPDVPGASGADAARAFSSVIRRASLWQGAPVQEFAPLLCVSTARWQLATDATLDALTALAAAADGTPSTPEIAPPRIGPWSAVELGRRLHLVNLHGATADPNWEGDPDFATVVSSTDVAAAGRISAVLLAECCFAAELWDPALAGGTPPLPLAYLAAGAYGVFGPTCISYGGRLTPDAADDMVRMAGEEILGGASLGRAVLTARQRYVAAQPQMTPVDLKTLAQFTLLGDPSVHPVRAAVPGPRAERRIMLANAGSRLARTTAITTPLLAPRPRRAGFQAYSIIDPSPVAGPTAAAMQIEVTVQRRTGTAHLTVREEKADETGATSPYRDLESR